MESEIGGADSGTQARIGERDGLVKREGTVFEKRVVRERQMEGEGARMRTEAGEGEGGRV
jgi:hypothetical protein